MSLLGNLFNKKDVKDEKITESIKAFEQKPMPKIKDVMATRGEGWESVGDLAGVGNVGLSSFNTFYSNYIDKHFENEVQRIIEYRRMASMTEVSDVIEDATNESTQVDEFDELLHLNIKNDDLSNNTNIVNNLTKEFNDLFKEKIDIEDILWDMVYSYYVDGRVYYERIIDTRHKKQGIINIKKLPSETMDYLYDPMTGKIQCFFQYLSGKRAVRPTTVQELEGRDDVILFLPEQIGFINNGVYGQSRYEILGYLEKAKIPYNQLKLLETSVIIYRIIRAPERIVFRIDTGNMPRDKALKYVEKIKQKMTKKQSYNPTTGKLSQDPEILSLLENYYVPQSADGRGSQIDTIGGNSAGFSELDDIYYFARKLYRALKYPISRVTAGQENRDADIMFGGGSTGEISRDEIKWSKFLERNQKKFCKELTKLFLLHLDFKGLKDQYGLDNKKISVSMNPPSKYKEQMEANFVESRHSNYQSLADREEMSKYFLMKRYLKWTDEDIQENVNGRAKDKQFGFVENDV